MKATNKKTKKIKDPLKTYQSILDAAIDVFDKKGFAAASLEEIAKKAEVTRGAIYWHFKDKHEVFEALQTRLHQPLNSSILDDIKEDHNNSLEQLEKLCVKLLSDLDNDKVRKKILNVFLCKCDYSNGMEKILEKQKKQKLTNIELFSSYFKRAKEKGHLEKNVDEKILAISLACYMCGLVSEYLRNPTLFNLKKEAKSLIAQFFKGIYHF